MYATNCAIAARLAADASAHGYRARLECREHSQTARVIIGQHAPEPLDDGANQSPFRAHGRITITTDGPEFASEIPQPIITAAWQRWREQHAGKRSA